MNVSKVFKMFRLNRLNRLHLGFILSVAQSKTSPGFSVVLESATIYARHFSAARCTAACKRLLVGCYIQLLQFLKARLVLLSLLITG